MIIMKHDQQRGFTLLEVMVALAVLAALAVMLMQTVGRYTESISQMRQRTLGSFVLSNQLARLMISQQLDQPLNLANRGSQQVEEQGQRWRIDWQSEVTGEQGTLRRVTFSATPLATDAEPIAPVATLTTVFTMPSTN